MKSVIIKKMEVTTLLMLKTNELIICIGNTESALFSTSLFFISHAQSVLLLSVCVSFPWLGIYENRNLLCFSPPSVWMCQTIWPAAWLQPSLLCLNISSAVGQCLPLSPLSGDGQQTVSRDTIMCLSSFRPPVKLHFCAT